MLNHYFKIDSELSKSNHKKEILIIVYISLNLI